MNWLTISCEPSLVGYVLHLWLRAMVGRALSLRIWLAQVVVFLVA